MASAHLVLQRYATALHELARAAGGTAPAQRMEQVEAVDAALVALSQGIARQPGLALQLGSPRLTRQAKRALLLALLAQAGNNDLVRRTVLLLIDKGRAGIVPDLAAVFSRVAMVAAGREVAHVESPTPIEPGARQELVAKLQLLTGKQITLEESIDAALIAGLRVRVGSTMIDGSLATRLERMREALMRAPLPAAAD